MKLRTILFLLGIVSGYFAPCMALAYSANFQTSENDYFSLYLDGSSNWAGYADQFDSSGKGTIDSITANVGLVLSSGTGQVKMCVYTGATVPTTLIGCSAGYSVNGYSAPAGSAPYCGGVKRAYTVSGLSFAGDAHTWVSFEGASGSAVTGICGLDSNGSPAHKTSGGTWTTGSNGVWGTVDFTASSTPGGGSTIASTTTISNPNQDFFNGIVAFFAGTVFMVWLFSKKR